MQFTYPLFDGDDEIGFISLQKDGLRLNLQAECKVIDGVHRAWAVSGDHRLLIGVLMPEGEKMRAKKTYTLSSLGSFDLSGVSHGDIRVSHQQSPWQRCCDPRSLFCDSVAKKNLDLNFEYRVKADEQGKTIAVPWNGGRFPMPGLFCLCSVECINGRQMVVLNISREGLPSTRSSQFSEKSSTKTRN